MTGTVMAVIVTGCSDAGVDQEQERKRSGRGEEHECIGQPVGVNNDVIGGDVIHRDEYVTTMR